jgi:hypothetical protein
MKIVAMKEVSDGTVTKILSVDDPLTEEDEERIEEYSSDLVIVFVEYEQFRDSIVLKETSHKESTFSIYQRLTQ